MKTTRLIFCAVLVAILLISTVFATGVKKNIEVLMNSINLTVNGKKVAADTIVYNGVTYVPLREAAEMLGKEVIWDQKTNTVSVNDEAETTSAVPASWKQVKVFEGNAIKDTEVFKITANEWRIIWETKVVNGQDGYFALTVRDADGHYVPGGALIGNTMSADHDTSYMRGSGDYYLSINAGINYKIIIEQK